jgi:hypothetical protein
MADLLERINVMLVQEARCYTTQDYLAPSFQNKLASQKLDVEALFAQDSAANSRTLASSRSSSSNVKLDAAPQGIASSTTSISSGSSSSELKANSGASSNARDSAAHTISSSSSSSGINEIWRERICEWAYQVIDHFDFSREIVIISMHYLDKYLATRFVDKKTFQLAAMTCLFIAIKLHAHGKLSMNSMIELSRGFFKPAQMMAMEMSILRSVFVQTIVALLDCVVARCSSVAKRNPNLLCTDSGNDVTFLGASIIALANPLAFRTSIVLFSVCPA